MDRQELKNLIINYVFDGENTTDPAGMDSIYYGLSSLFNDIEYFYKNTGLGITCTGFDGEDQDLCITAYSEKIGGFDVMIEYITRYSIDGITDHIMEAIRKQNLF